MYVYEIEYEYSNFGYSDTAYIVGDTMEDVLQWIKQNSSYKITNIRQLGRCHAIIPKE